MAEPEERLYFLLQRAAHQLRRSADRRLIDSAGITAPQLGALFAVRERPGLTQRELARTLGLGESGVTALVTRLAAAGLIERRPHPSEHRAMVLRLSDGGAAALRAAQPEIDRFNADLRARIGDEAFTVTAAAMSRLVDDDAP